MGADDKFFAAGKGRFIPKEELGTALSWRFESLVEPQAAPAEPDADHAQARAFERGHAEGYAAGVAHAQREAAAVRESHAERIGQVLGDLRQRFAELEEHGAQQVLDLAVEIARQVVRHEVAQVHESLLPLVREAVAQLIEQHSRPRVHLHPADHALIVAELQADASLAGCHFLADPAVARGGCRVETPQSLIDASLATRWARAIATLGVAAPWQDAARDGGSQG